jgi:SAM-dependent methyltransferase
VAARHRVRERQLGLGGDFDYTACANCGSLSIVEVPANLGHYYAENYYAYSPPPKPTQRRVRWGGDWRAELDATARMKRTMRQIWGRLRVGQEARVLDVGCGHGQWLAELAQLGYTRLTGIDRFLPESVVAGAGFSLQRAGIDDVEAGWDLIAYHHVLEHVADPALELNAAVARLRPGGILLLRVPVADSWARRHYGVNWAQWDAPRHLWIPTRAALRVLAGERGLEPLDERDDSFSFQVWASRRYRAGLNGFVGRFAPQGRGRHYWIKVPGLIGLWCWTAALNAVGQGDQTIQVWRKPA